MTFNGHSKKGPKFFFKSYGAVMAGTGTQSQNEGLISALGHPQEQYQEKIVKLNALKELLIRQNPLQEKLKCITDKVVEIFEADFARIWITRAGDLCEKGCRFGSVTEGPEICRNRTCCLHLIASSGRYTHIDGDHRRVPLGCYKIGRVASGEELQFITNDVTHDLRVHDREWARTLGLVSFAGFRLLSGEGNPVGVLALFSKRIITPEDEKLLQDLANTTSQVILAGIAEDALRRSEQQYRLLFETMLQGVVYQDAEGKIISMNPAAERILGKFPADFLGRTSINEEHHTLREDGSPFPGLEHPSMVALRTGKEQKDVVMGIHNPIENAYRWISISAVPLFLEGEKKPYQVYTIFNDITERNRAENDIRRRSGELQALNDLIRKINSTLSLDAVIQTAMETISNLVQTDLVLLFVREGEDLILKGLGPRNPRLDPREFPIHHIGRCLCGIAVQTGKPTYSSDIHADVRCTMEECKKLGFKSFAALPLHTGQGVLGVLGFGWYTEQNLQDRAAYLETVAGQVAAACQNAILYKQVQHHAEELERRVQERTAELVQSNQDLEQFAYVASHDLQEPLRMVASYVQLLEMNYKDKLDDNARQFIAYAVEGAIRMQSLIKDLLAYARVSTQGRLPGPVDGETVLRQVLDNLKMDIEETHATITHDPLPTVTADQTQLIQVFQNLIGNALKFRKEDESPKIHVGAEHRSREWLFSVEDNGIGIEPQYHDRVFTLFQRLHPRQKFPGTGIGLTIVKRIIERHGGKIYIESNVGEGTTFYFTLPDKQ